MGEMSEMLINGDCDFYTGEYIGRGGGYPRTLDKSLSWEKKRGFNGHNKMQGVTKWLYHKGVTNGEDAHSIIKIYSDAMGWVITNKRFVMKACCEIQKDFPAFVKWFNESKGRL